MVVGIVVAMRIHCVVISVLHRSTVTGGQRRIGFRNRFGCYGGGGIVGGNDSGKGIGIRYVIVRMMVVFFGGCAGFLRIVFTQFAH